MKLLIIPGKDFLRAYAGTRYLIDHLNKKNVPLIVWIQCEKYLVNEYKKLPFKCRIFPLLFSNIRIFYRLQIYGYRLFIFLRLLFAKKVLITESIFLREVAFAKKIKGDHLKIVQFCQELHIPEEYPELKVAHWYAKYAQIPNLVIDVEPNRAQIRKDRFALQKDPLILLNTIPFNSLPKQAPKGTLEKITGFKFPQNTPILLHMGGIGKEKPLERIIDAISMCKQTTFFLAFCNGEKSHIQRLQKYAKIKLRENSYLILSGIDRDILLKSAWEADVGVIDYTYSVEPSSNQKFCAPTKLYEFMALGLAVLGSNNDSLRQVIELEKIGACATNDSEKDLAVALSKIITSPSSLNKMKNNSKKTFAEKFSYEQVCDDVVEKIIHQIKIL